MAKAFAQAPVIGSQRVSKNAEGAGSHAKVYFTKHIDAEHLCKLYDLINESIYGKVAIKLHTGEPNGPNILPRDWVRKLQAAIPAPLWSATFSLPALGMGSPEYEWIAL